MDALIDLTETEQHQQAQHTTTSNNISSPFTAYPSPCSQLGNKSDASHDNKPAEAPGKEPVAMSEPPQACPKLSLSRRPRGIATPYLQPGPPSLSLSPTHPAEYKPGCDNNSGGSSFAVGSTDNMVSAWCTYYALTIRYSR